MYTGVIYKAESPNGKKYFGQTIQKFQYRKNRHIRDANNNSQWRFHQALRKYDFNFIWEIVETYNNENKQDLVNILNERESFLVKTNNTHLFEYGYNSSFGGDNSIVKRSPHSQKTKDKIRKSLEGIKHTSARRENSSRAHKGINLAKNFGPVKYGENHPNFIKISKERLEQIIYLHTKEYKTVKQIALIIGVNWVKILKLLRDNNSYIEYSNLLKLRKINER